MAARSSGRWGLLNANAKHGPITARPTSRGAQALFCASRRAEMLDARCTSHLISALRGTAQVGVGV